MHCPYCGHSDEEPLTTSNARGISIPFDLYTSKEIVFLGYWIYEVLLYKEKGHRLWRCLACSRYFKEPYYKGRWFKECHTCLYWDQAAEECYLKECVHGHEIPWIVGT